MQVHIELRACSKSRVKMRISYLQQGKKTFACGIRNQR